MLLKTFAASILLTG